MQRLLLFIATALLLHACNPLGNDGPAKDHPQTPKSANAISEVRENPKTAPVGTFEQKVQNDLNKWIFRVRLYETSKRFVYRMMMEYEEIKEETEITFPNLNIEPVPQMKEGSKEHEAIIGFLDEKSQFREYLSVFVEDGNLRVKQLKHYAVYTK